MAEKNKYSHRASLSFPVFYPAGYLTLKFSASGE